MLARWRLRRGTPQKPGEMPGSRRRRRREIGAVKGYGTRGKRLPEEPRSRTWNRLYDGAESIGRRREAYAPA